jgi:subtilase family serine protease
MLGAAVITAAAAPVGASAETNANSRAVCAPLWGQAACMARVVTDANGTMTKAASPDELGVESAALTPAQLHSAYNLPTMAPGTPTIAIVDALDNPNVELDLAHYSATYGLPPCTTANGCFRKVNENGGAGPLPLYDAGWAMEIDLDVEVAHAVCQSCRILLVEAASPTMLDLARAESTALTLGATVVSNSWGGSELAGEQNPAFNHRNVAITASTGDAGFGTSYPAADPNVIAVGGTTLLLDGSGRRSSETAWSGAGSGCSQYLSAQPFQTSVGNWASTGCGIHRATADVSAVADPNTGAAVYITLRGSAGAWYQVGGTSLSAPLIAAVFALGGHSVGTAFPASLLYTHATSLFDVTSGSNGSCPHPVMCHAGAGYDGPTGLGTPNGLGAF